MLLSYIQERRYAPFLDHISDIKKKMQFGRINATRQASEPEVIRATEPPS